MGDILSGILGTNSQVGVNTNDPLSNLSPWIAQNQTLANQLQAQSAGGGPNPAQLQLQQNAQQIAQAQAMQNAQNRALSPGLAARMAGQNAVQAGQQAAGTAAAQQAQQQLGSQQALGNLISSQQHNINSASAVNAGVAAGNQQAAQGAVSGLLNGAAAALSLARGGMVPHFELGGPVMGSEFASVPAQPSLGANIGYLTPSPEFGPNLGAMNFGVNQLQMPELGQSVYGNAPASQNSEEAKQKRSGKLFDFGDPVAALARFQGMTMSKGGQVEGPKSFIGKHIKSFKSGGPVRGKAKVEGDSLKNDTVRAMLSPGEIVLPRSVTTANDAPQRAARFVAAVLAKHGRAGALKK